MKLGTVARMRFRTLNGSNETSGVKMRPIESHIVVVMF